MRVWQAVVMGAVFVVGCDPPEPDLGVATEYASELEVDLERMTRMPSGLYYEVLEVGSGEMIERHDTVLVHYEGWLPDGALFYSTRRRDLPFRFLVGAGRAIPGMDEAVQGMRVGEHRLLVVPAPLGYGNEGLGELIPPGTTLVMEVHLEERLPDGPMEGR